MSTLFLVATPIGNLEDISPRALDTLRGVGLIAAEDTRTARQLLTHFEISTPVTSFFEHSKSNKLNHILGALDLSDVAVISEAGMPGINDPGHELVRAALGRGHRVSPIPGASAVLAALVASDIEAGSFYFVGYLPREPQTRRKFLRELVNERQTIVAFETPHRLRDALEDLENIFGPARRMCTARELTKMFEEFQRGTVREVRAYFQTVEPRGEFTFVIEGAPGVRAPAPKGGRGQAANENAVWDEARVRGEFAKLTRSGATPSDAVKHIAGQAKWSRQKVYQIALKQKKAMLKRK